MLNTYLVTVNGCLFSIGSQATSPGNRQHTLLSTVYKTWWVNWCEVYIIVEFRGTVFTALLTKQRLRLLILKTTSLDVLVRVWTTGKDSQTWWLLLWPSQSLLSSTRLMVNNSAFVPLFIAKAGYTLDPNLRYDGMRQNYEHRTFHSHLSACAPPRDAGLLAICLRPFCTEWSRGDRETRSQNIWAKVTSATLKLFEFNLVLILLQSENLFPLRNRFSKPFSPFEKLCKIRCDDGYEHTL